MVKNNYFLDLLIEKKIVSEDKISQLREQFQSDAFEILMYLVKNNYADKHQLGRLWGDSIGISYVDIKKLLFLKIL